jgi:RES domain-containing protein
MEAFRIGSPAFPLLDGAGAAASNRARWNSRGRYVIYASEHYATALLETAAQLGHIRIPRSLRWIRVTVPVGASVEEARPEDVTGWDADDKAASQHFGDHWYDERRSLVLLVPSLAAPGVERNVLINQRHSEFPRVEVSVPEPVRCHPGLLV